MAEKLSDDQIVSICESEISAASGFTSGELAENRADAMDYYLGEPYGDEIEGRSQYRSREVLETIQNLMPSLMRIFAESENLVTFDPVGPEDEDVAKQESDRVNYCYWKENRGFFNTLTFCQDALLSKTGIFIAYWQDGKVEREEYKNISEIELLQLMEDPSVKREIVEGAMNDDGTVDVVIEATPNGTVCIETVPAEELGVNRDARTPYAQDCKFVYRRVRRSMSDLIEAGYDRKLVESIPTNDDVETEERLSRRHLDDESDILRFGSHPSMRTLWVTECYVYLDRDGDGITELLKVTLAAGAGEISSGARLMDIEEIDAIPIFTAPPSILTHKFYGLSVADLVMDIQRIKSTLIRQMLDNTYLTNNQRTHVNEQVNLDDLLTKRPGGVVRHKGTNPPAGNMSPEPVTALPSDTYGLLDHFDDVIKDRSGAANDVAGLDVGALANLNTGVAAMALDRIRMKVELIAQILAEVGFRPLFQHVHSLLQKNQDRREVIQLRGKWVPVNPSEWRDRKNVTVSIGVGVASRERRLMGFQDIWEKQQAVIQGGGMGMLVTPQHVHSLLTDYVEAWGFDSEKYWQDPSQAEPPPPPPPDPQIAIAQMMAQVEMEKAKGARERNQIEAAKVQRDGQISILDLQMKHREDQLRKEIESIKLDRERLKDERDSAQGHAKLAYDLEIKTRDQELKGLMAKLDDERKAKGQQLDLYKALLKHSEVVDGRVLDDIGMGTSEMDAKIEEESEAKKQLEALRAMMDEMSASRQELIEQRNAPIVIERDESGRAVRVGGRQIVRDARGLMERIG